MSSAEENRPPADDRGAGEAVERSAADWLALRETRPLTADEAREFAAWRAADPRHEAAVAELEGAWRTFDRLRAYPRETDLAADPDALVRRRVSPARWLVPLAAAAAVALVALVWPPSRSDRPAENVAPVASVASASDVVRLPDGSEVELRPGSRIEPAFTAHERRVRLVRGEAHFAVRRDPARPFLVEAQGVGVRALGTAFNVRLAEGAVEVIVTEGTVGLDAGAPVPPLVAGQRALVASAARAAPAVSALTPAEIDRALAWQPSRLVFEATPLADVIAQFSHHSGRRILLRDQTLARLPISGRFRASNLDSFLKLLETGFDVRVERGPGEVALSRRRK